MKTYKQLYKKAIIKGNLRRDEDTVENFIDDINELSRLLWTKIYQGYNGDKPNNNRMEKITITGGNLILDRLIKKTPILKIVSGCCKELKKKTDNSCDTCGNYEYNDEKIFFKNVTGAEYTIFYEEPVFTEITQEDYDNDAKPEWIKDNFEPLFWSYFAMINSEDKREENLATYLQYESLFNDYYERTEDYEGLTMGVEKESNY